MVEGVPDSRDKDQGAAKSIPQAVDALDLISDQKLDGCLSLSMNSMGLMADASSVLHSTHVDRCC